jgi:copper chaperone CopZ/uncharacterized membrane protein YphA (DoxX/SURF4 family)
MTNTYNISGITCTGCQAKVKGLLSKVNDVENVEVDLSTGTTEITIKKHIALNVLKEALKEYPKYQITEGNNNYSYNHNGNAVAPASWIVTYKPVLLIFGYITVITIAVELLNVVFDWMRWMNHFMAGFFLVCSFFKLLNLKGFAESYAMYDIIAKKWSGWGYVYAFTELVLGIAYLTGFQPLLTNTVTFVIMSVSIIGVLQSVYSKRKIKCACLGDVFNLPMSTITIIEDALMIGMSAVMLLTMF